VTTTELSIPVDAPGIAAASAILDEPAPGAERGAVLLAHGASAPMSSPLLTAVAEGLCRRGLTALRFHYPYMELRERGGLAPRPDPRSLLLATHARALEALRERAPGRRLLLCGKSLGARMGSLLAAEGCPHDGLVHLGFPLHPPGRPEKLRSEHFGRIQRPSLFLQGTRDPFCDLDLLRREIERLGGPVRLEILEGADHGFEVEAASGRSAREVRENLCELVDAWEARTWPR